MLLATGGEEGESVEENGTERGKTGHVAEGS